jgi:hypothetical protein
MYVYKIGTSMPMLKNAIFYDVECFTETVELVSASNKKQEGYQWIFTSAM